MAEYIDVFGKDNRAKMLVMVTIRPGTKEGHLSKRKNIFNQSSIMKLYYMKYVIINKHLNKEKHVYQQNYSRLYVIKLPKILIFQAHSQFSDIYFSVDM